MATDIEFLTSYEPAIDGGFKFEAHQYEDGLRT